jgi:hypothetical protein
LDCHSCGHLIGEDEARFCSRCGAELAAASPVETLDRIAAIDGAVDAFEDGELQRALDVLDEELDRAEEVNDEVALIYLLDVSRQMVAQLEEGEFENLEQLVSDAKDALEAVQRDAVSTRLRAARASFAEGDRAKALELLCRELVDASTADDEATDLVAWRVFALAAEIADGLDGWEALPFEGIRLSAERRLQIASEQVNADQARTLMRDEVEAGEEIEEAEQESVLEPFETPNPWLQKLFEMPAYGTVPSVALGLLREVSPDHDEVLLAAIKVQHGRVRRGYLLATTNWLRWIGTFPTRQDDLWSYDYKLEYRGLSLAKAVIILASGDQFQTWRVRGKPFVEMYNVIQQARVWNTANMDQIAVDAIAGRAAPSAESLAEELRKLSEMHQQGILTAEEFAAAKQKLTA